ncbi:hypothetical protein ACFPL7_00090 [Dongia soli]|uniref:Uncharacterized protein n=1 Tax=Dongia soli TaxID=600628 RepID=A0ABU5EHX5_9PROT|nr:hypothetical protein [Dongia soli]MDY0885917.1 hypothetical protein [Dongia soli]
MRARHAIRLLIVRTPVVKKLKDDLRKVFRIAAKGSEKINGYVVACVKQQNAAQ